MSELADKLRSHQYKGFDETNALLNEAADTLDAIREKLESIVCTKGCDSGVVLLSQDGPTHPEVHDGKTIQVYDHEYFSPLGDALIELYELVNGNSST